MSFNPGGTAGDMVRMIDIAERAGVSLGTVSAVLSGRGKSIRFSKEKAEKIRAIAREMNYIPNFSAKMLSGQSSHTLGVLVDSEDVAVRFEQLAAIEREAEQCGYRLLVAEAHRNPEKQLMNYRTLRQYGVDGVICHENSIHDELRGESGVVLYGAEPVEGFSTVCYDVRSGYAEALAAFEAEGRRNVALAIREQPEFDSIRARRRAFRELCPHGQIYALPEADCDMREAAEKLVRTFIRPREIDAVILQNDVWALALLFELLHCGVRVPEEISLVGQDNSQFCRCTRPALSTIDSNLNGLGKAVMESMLERIAEPDAPLRAVSVGTWLIRRETTLG